jgi:hypothetical protein
MPITVDTRPTRRHPKANREDQRPRFREAADVWSSIATGWADALDDAVEAMGRGLDSQSDRRRTKGKACGCEHEDCSCERSCESDSCHCQCCISDADLVVYARLGEVRIVPIRLENHRRRAREITLDLGDFRTSGGRSVPLAATIVGERSFELEACEERVVTLAIRPGQVDGPDGNSDDRVDKERGDLPDVDDCLVAYTDLRVAGCDIRSIRIAVALLPRDCDAYVAECGCGCC